MMNIYESMNRAFDKALKESLGKAKPAKKVSLEESVSVMDKLYKAYPELKEYDQVNEEMEDPAEVEEKKPRSKRKVDLWDEVYGKLTMSGDTEPSGKTTKFGTGAGYDYRNQVWVGVDGEICIGANSLDELRPAADIAGKYADRGVEYNLHKCSKYNKYPYCITICVPEEEIQNI